MPAEEWRLFDCFWFNENALESTLLKFMLELNYRWALNARIKLFSFCFKGRSHNNWNIKYFPERSNIIWPWQHFEYLVDASTPLPEKAMALHSSTLAWKSLWTEETGRLQSMGSLRVRHDWVTSLSLFIFMHWRRKWQPTPVFLPGESQGRGSLVGCRLWGCTDLDTTAAT